MSIYTLGIDIGSTASKCIMLSDGKEIVAKSLIAVGAGTSGPQRAIDQVLAEANVATTPGAGFGPSGEGYVRLTTFGDAEDTRTAVERVRNMFQ